MPTMPDEIQLRGQVRRAYRETLQGAVGVVEHSGEGQFLGLESEFGGTD